MKKKVIIFGIDQFSELIFDYLSVGNEYEVCGFTVDSKFAYTNSFYQLPLIPFEEVEKFFSPIEYGIFICMGYTKMNKIREERFEQATQKGFQIMSYCHPSAIVNTIDIGIGNIIMEGVIIGSKCKIGNGNVFWAAAHVAHHTEVGNFNFFTISVAVAGNIKIKNNCFFGNNCTIKNGLTIEDYSLIGAGTYLDKNTERYEVYVPARSYKLDNQISTDLI